MNQPIKIKRIKRRFRARRIRAKILGSADRPRLSVFRSNRHIYAQLINDAEGITVASVSDLDLEKTDKIKRTDLAKMVGRVLAKKSQELKIDKAVFDKGAYKYHGSVKALADGAREEGLKF